MKTNYKYPNRWFLCLLLTLVLFAMPACQTQPTQEPTLTTLPEPPTATVAQPTQGPTSTALPEPPRATVDQVKQWMDQGEPLVFLDSRGAADWQVAKTKVPGSLRVPPTDVEQYLDQIPRDKRIIAYCS